MLVTCIVSQEYGDRIIVSIQPGSRVLLNRKLLFSGTPSAPNHLFNVACKVSPSSHYVMAALAGLT